MSGGPSQMSSGELASILSKPAGGHKLGIFERNNLPFPAGMEYTGDFGKSAAGTFASMPGREGGSHEIGG